MHLYFTCEDGKTITMERLLKEKHIPYEKIWTPDTDTPYVVICGIEPIHYDDFIVWINEQKPGCELTLGGVKLSQLGFKV